MPGPMTPALQSLIEKQVSGKFEASPISLTVGLTPQKIIGHNFERVTMAIVNLGTDNLFIWTNPSVSLTHGIKLAGNGGFLSLNAKDDFILVGHEWYGLMDVAPGDISIMQIIRYQH